MPLIATNCVSNNSLYPSYDTTRFVDDATYNSWFRGHPEPGDILFVCKGSPGRTNWVPDPVDFCIAQDMVAVRADPVRVYPKYLFAALRSTTVQSQIDNMHVGTMIPHFKKGDFGKLKIPIPSRAAQQFIGDYYFAMSERIAQLRETNATLEAIAQALFKSWFVDFDPVCAKAEGRESEGIDSETAALFPDGFEESELGQVPRGWGIGDIGGIADVIDCLHSKKPELLTDGKPFLQLNTIRDDGLLDISRYAFISDNDYKKWTSRIEVLGGDCVITNVGRVGAVAQVPAGERAAMGRNMTAIRTKADWPYPTFLIELLLSPSMRAEIRRRTDVGTILDALNVRNIPTLRCIMPPPAVVRHFEELARPLRAGMEQNLKRAAVLSNLRDALLSRLISGQLRLPEAEAMLEVAAKHNGT
ncbi:restriction endonuclease subunit S [Paraburkholderia flagellata]|uniref:restriction endonuclease subunit S n=1 Tax=Paraburkholderia flagellata TaxID=2883241 RepID=UPI001F3FA1FC|nr:restriction endonuclease subunit S [Paraburkholderia flagellata]